MGFSLRLAPGLRVRASSRGLRTSIGPRAARIHVGSGRTGFSTGIGPVGYYTSVGGRRSSVSSGSTDPSRATGAGATARELIAADKLGEAQAIIKALQALSSLHLRVFPPATRHVVEPEPVPSLLQLQAAAEKENLRGLGFFARSAKAAARQRALQDGQRRWHGLKQESQDRCTAEQRSADLLWAKLTANDPATVLGGLAGAFEDNEAAAAPVGIHQDEVSVVVLVPTEDVIPERYPTTTSAGNLSLPRMTKSMRSEFYLAFVCGHVVTTVREALAVAPKLSAVRVVVLRFDGTDIYGKPLVTCLLAGRFTRVALQGVQWSGVSAIDVVFQAGSEVECTLKGSPKKFCPLDLSEHPDIAAVISAVDIEGLAMTPRS